MLSVRVLLVLPILILSAVVTSAQRRPSDAEMQAVIKLLIEREVDRRDDVVVLLDANVHENWIPQIPGMSIRKLSYDEEKQVTEYYSVIWSLKGGAIEISLMKGNYCRKAGRQYLFRRNAESWAPKQIGYAESTSIGNRCDGCEIGSGAIYSVNRQFPTPTVAQKPDRSVPEPLVLTGKTTEVSCSKKQSAFVVCKANLKLSFSNVGATSLIIMQPTEENEFWHGGTTLALSEQEGRTGPLVYDLSAWQSLHRGTEYQRLADLLDKPDPPARLTRVLRPAESWHWDTSIQFSLNERNSCNQHVGVEIGWNEINRLTTPLWLTVSYEMWPFNVENLRSKLGETLQRRWRRFGRLYLNEKEKGDRHSHAIIRSEPMELDLRGVTLGNDKTP